MRLLKAISLITTSIIISTTSAYADHYEFDKSHTHIAFLVNHLGFSDMLGIVTGYNGTFEFDQTHPENSKVDVTLKPDSIQTSSDILDHVLHGSRFFNIETFPEIHFVSTSARINGENNGDINGNLTMLGVTKPVVLHVHFNKAGYNPITNLYVAGFNAETTIKRSDFGMTYLVPEVADEVNIHISTEGINQDRKKTESLKH